MVSRTTLYKQLCTSTSDAVARLKAPPKAAKLETLVAKVQNAVPDASEDQVRRALRKAIRKCFSLPRPRSGSKPNTSMVLSEEEIAFIEHAYGGRRSEAIHKGLKLLMEKDRDGR